MAVHQEGPAGGGELEGDLLGGQLGGLGPVPDDGPLAAGLLYQDGGALAGRSPGHGDVSGVDALALELADRKLAQLVPSNLSDVGTLKSPAAQSHHGGGHLPSPG